MRTDTVVTEVYQYGELSEEARQTALEKMYDINVSHLEWWESTYEDAGRAHLKISEFDIDRASYVNAEFIDTARVTAEAIVKEHGDHCESYKTAKQFLSDWDKLVEKYSDGIKVDQVSEENEFEFDTEADDLEDELLKSISEDYRIMLSNHYDYLTSEEAIVETIQSNEYEFEADGTQY